MKTVMMILAAMMVMPAYASEAVIVQQQESYRAAGAESFSAERGKRMWRESHPQQQSGKAVSCATCHSSNLKQAGAHIRTAKVINPMALSMADSERLNDPAKIEKWFLRNCKWTLGRECTVQEKGDFLAYFQSE